MKASLRTGSFYASHRGDFPMGLRGDFVGFSPEPSSLTLKLYLSPERGKASREGPQCKSISLKEGFPCLVRGVSER